MEKNKNDVFVIPRCSLIREPRRGEKISAKLKRTQWLKRGLHREPAGARKLVQSSKTPHHWRKHSAKAQKIAQNNIFSKKIIK